MIKMNEEELHKLFHRIELDKSSDSCGFEFADGFDCTFDNIATCYDDRLKLYDLVKQLQNNWNELKKHLEKQIIDSKAGSSQQYYFNTIYKFMQELEQGK